MRIYENPQKTSENRKTPRSYYIPKGVSEYMLLNGTWDFAYFSRDIDVPEKIEKWDTVEVPSCWQLQGYENPNYTNVNYPYPVDIPYVPYVRPQEHGNHNGVKLLRIGKLEFTARQSFECNVSKYSTDALFKAEHTDELVEDGKVHLRVDYKVSGIGSHSCGPALAHKHRLEEKQILFRFSVAPV